MCMVHVCNCPLRTLTLEQLKFFAYCINIISGTMYWDGGSALDRNL